MTFGGGTRNTLAVATACLIALPAGAQTIRIAAPTEVGRETDPRRFVEPHLAVDPNDPDHVLAGVFVSWVEGAREEMQANQRCAAFVSRDKGQSWSRHDFPLVDCALSVSPAMTNLLLTATSSQPSICFLLSRTSIVAS